MNEAQKICARTYGNGDSAWMADTDQAVDGGWQQWIKDCGDTLFRFLMLELSEDEDCGGLKDAIARCRTARDEVETVMVALENADEALVS